VLDILKLDARTMKRSPEISNKWSTYRCKTDILMLYNQNEGQVE